MIIIANASQSQEWMMCFQIRNDDMLDWLRMQVRVLEAWREHVATAPELDVDMITRLEHHYQWLTSEVYALEKAN